MSRVIAAGISVFALVAAVACSKQETPTAEPQQERTSQAPEGTGKQETQGQQQPAGNPFQAAEEMMKALSGGASGDKKPVPPIDYKKLKDALPQVSGWTREEPRGEMATFGQWSYSIASADYGKGGARVECKIHDYAYISALTASYMMMFSTNFSRESDEGYEKSVNVGGNPGFEKWEKKNRSADLTLWVGKRLIVVIEGDDVDDPSVLRDFAGAIDYGKIGPLS